MTTPSILKSSIKEDAFKKPSIRDNNPLTNSIIEKLVSSNNNGNGQQNQNINLAPNINTLQKISSITSSNSTDAKNLIQLLPDIEMSILILISLILSPKDLKTVEIGFKTNTNVFKNESTSLLLKVISEYFLNTYKIKEILPEILREALFEHGSYSLLVLPESSIDEIINSNSIITSESFNSININDLLKKHKGILSNFKKSSFSDFSFENFNNKENYNPTFKIDFKENKTDLKNDLEIQEEINIIDNEQFLKYPIVRKKAIDSALENLYPTRLKRKKKLKTSVENNDIKIPSRNFKANNGLIIKTIDQLEKKNIGQPLIMRVPPEAIIPVHVPSNPNKHLGAFILIDENGNFINSSDQKDLFNDLSTSVANRGNALSQTISSVDRFANGLKHSNNYERQEIFKAYSQLIEKEILSRLKNGIYGNDIDVSSSTDAYRIMFSRSLMKMKTQLLYVPEKLLTYFAFDHNDYGIGKSLIEKSKILLGIRAILTFNDTLAHIKNSINQTVVEINLDERDIDPTKTVEFLINEQAKINSGMYPLGVTNAVDILNYIQNASINYQVNGNTRYPNTKVNVEHKSPNNSVVDQDLRKNIKDDSIRAFGLTPSIIDDSSTEASFAYEVATKNLFQQKTANLLREKFLLQLTSFIKKVILNHGDLIDKLKSIINENSKLKENALEIIEDGKKKEVESKSTDVNNNLQDYEVPNHFKETSLSNESVTVYKKTGIKLDDQLFNKVDKNDNNENDDDIDVDDIIFNFVNSIEVTLPSFDDDTANTMLTEIDNRSKLIDSVLTYFIDSSFLDNNLFGEMSNSVDSAKNSIKALMMRDWIRSAGIMPEIDKLTTTDEHTGKPYDLLNNIDLYLENLSKTLLPLLKKISDDKKSRDEKFLNTVDTTNSNNGSNDSTINDNDLDNENNDTFEEPNLSNDENLDNENNFNQNDESENLNEPETVETKDEEIVNDNKDSDNKTETKDEEIVNDNKDSDNETVETKDEEINAADDKNKDEENLSDN